jgi:hypothetical protein
MQGEASKRAIIHALKLLKLSGELYGDDYRLDPARVRRFFQRESVQQIQREAEALLQQGVSIEQAARAVADRYGVFLKDACQIAAGDWGGMDFIEQRGANRRMYEKTGDPQKTQGVKTSIRIPADWLPEAARREAERYLSYLQSKTRASVDAYLNALARYFGGSENDGVEFLLERLKASPCVRYYQGREEIFLRSYDELRVWKQRNKSNRAGFKPSLFTWCEVVIPDTSVADLAASHFCVAVDRLSLIANRSNPDGFFYGKVDTRDLFSYDGAVFIASEKSCKMCEGCTIMSGIMSLLWDVWYSLKYWTRYETDAFVLLGTPLPSYIGFARCIRPSSDAPTCLFSEQFNRDIERVGLLLSGAELELQIIPRFSAESVAAIYKRLVPQVEARGWALRAHASSAIYDAAIEAGKRNGSYVQDWNAPLSKSAIQSLLTDWNTHAPPEWRYTSPNAEKVFRKALRNARRAIDGIGEGAG